MFQMCLQPHNKNKVKNESDTLPKTFISKKLTIIKDLTDVDVADT